jgi:flagellar motor component MotA
MIVVNKMTLEIKEILTEEIYTFNKRKDDYRSNFWNKTDD